MPDDSPGALCAALMEEGRMRVDAGAELDQRDVVLHVHQHAGGGSVPAYVVHERGLCLGMRISDRLLTCRLTQARKK